IPAARPAAAAQGGVAHAYRVQAFLRRAAWTAAPADARARGVAAVGRRRLALGALAAAGSSERKFGVARGATQTARTRRRIANAEPFFARLAKAAARIAASDR